MEDLTNYTDQELSLRVFNDESLYTLRSHTDSLEEAITNLFIFTPEQYGELWQDIADDAEEA